MTNEGASIDPSKIIAISNWLTPSSVKQLRGRSFALTGYYRKFTRGYGVISHPLIELLKKDSFHWSLDATQAFESLKKEIMTHDNGPHLAKFNRHLYYGDASHNGIGVMLMQMGHLVAYISKALSRGNKHFRFIRRNS